MQMTEEQKQAALAQAGLPASALSPSAPLSVYLAALALIGVSILVSNRIARGS
jgi:hypothetical protein